MPVIKLYAGLRTAAGLKETRVDGDRLRDILQTLVEQHPGLAGAVLDGDHLRPHVVITVNGAHVDPEAGLLDRVNPGDQIAIFPPIAGG